MGRNVVFKDNSKQILQAERKALEAALTKIGIAAKHNVQNIIQEKDIYDTGELYRTIDYKERTEDRAVDIGSTKDYAVFQELGTVKQTARPFLRPGIMDNIDEYKNIAAETLGSALGGSVGGLQTKSKYYKNDSRVSNV